MNPQLRKQVLARDEYQCQLSKLFGITELTGAPCSEDLEVHHIRYGRDVPEDLTTVCKRCHELLTDAIREIRFAARRTQIDSPDSPKLPTPLARIDEEARHERIEVQVDGYDAFAVAQRSACESNESVRKGNEKSLIEACQNGRGLRGDGAVGVSRRIVFDAQGTSTVHPS